MIINDKSGSPSNNIVNGVVEEYYALTDDINADTFVEFVKYGKNETNTLNSSLESTFSYGSYGVNYNAIKLSEDRVFITYHYYDGSYLKSCAAVCAISGTKISIGTQAVLINHGSSSSNDSYIRATLIAENKVLVTYNGSTKNIMNARVCTIDGTSITVGDIASIESTANINAANTASIVTLSENKVFITYQNTSEKSLYGVVCTVTNSTITVGTKTRLTESSLYLIGTHTYRKSVCTLDENTVFIAFSASTSSSSNYGFLYGVICTISDLTINIGTVTKLTTGTSGYILTHFNCIKLSSDEVFISYMYSSSALNCMVCTVSGTTITTKFKDQQISDSNHSGYNGGCCISDNRVFITYSVSSKVYSVICNINDSSITLEEPYYLCDNPSLNAEPFIIKLNDNKLFIYYDEYISASTSYYVLKALTFNTKPLVKHAESKIYGLTKNGFITEDAIGQIFTLATSEQSSKVSAGTIAGSSSGISISNINEMPENVILIRKNSKTIENDDDVPIYITTSIIKNGNNLFKGYISAYYASSSSPYGSCSFGNVYDGVTFSIDTSVKANHKLVVTDSNDLTGDWLYFIF